MYRVVRQSRIVRNPPETSGNLRKPAENLRGRFILLKTYRKTSEEVSGQSVIDRPHGINIYLPKTPQAVNIPPTAIETKSNPVVTFLDSFDGVLSILNEPEMKPSDVSEKNSQPYWTNALNLFSGVSLQIESSSSEMMCSEIKNKFFLLLKIGPVCSKIICSSIWTSI
jgi:hypothetical protein